MSSLGLEGCQQEGLSRFRDVKGKPDQEKVRHYQTRLSRKKYQGERVPRDHAGNGRDNQAARSRSYRLSLFFIDFLLLSFETSVTRLARALLSFHGE